MYCIRLCCFISVIVVLINCGSKVEAAAPPRSAKCRNLTTQFFVFFKLATHQNLLSAEENIYVAADSHHHQQFAQHSILDSKTNFIVIRQQILPGVITWYWLHQNIRIPMWIHRLSCWPMQLKLPKTEIGPAAGKKLMMWQGTAMSKKASMKKQVLPLWCIANSWKNKMHWLYRLCKKNELAV